MPLLLDLKDYVLHTVQPVPYYLSVFPAWDHTTRPNVTCPFHDDRTASMAVALHGGGAKCHASGCGRSFGNIVHFESALKNCAELDAARTIFSLFIRPVVPDETLRNFRDSLRSVSGTRLLKLVQEQHALASDVTSQFGCGYDARSNRLVIPIENAYGLVVNLRFYKPRKLRTVNEITCYNYVENKGRPDERKYGGNELFPWQKLRDLTDDYPVFIMASEKETMLAYQLGLQAVCATAGEGSWQASWSDLFVGRKVGILMDPDAGGEKATARLIKELSSVALFSAPLRLPFPRGFRGPQDFDDWVVHSGGSAERLLALFEQQRNGGGGTGENVQHPARGTVARTTAHRVLPAGRAASAPVSGTTESLGVPATTGPRLPEAYASATGDNNIAVDAIRRTPDALNRIVTSHGLVSGIAPRSYSIPYKFKVKAKQGPPVVFTIPVGRELLGFINAPDKTVSDVVLRMCSASKNTTVEVIGHQTVTELELIPLADQLVESGDSGGYTVQRCFAFGVDLQANVAYRLRLVPTTMPQTQETIGVIIEAKEIDRAENFELTEDVCKRFRNFAPSEKGIGDSAEVWKRLDLLAAELSEHHTHIYERPDWHMVVMVTFFCPLQWTWPLDGKLQRGWINTLAVGDTKTGKSEVTNIVTSQLLKAGSTVNSENCTYVGLVGGAIKGASGQFMLRWGRIPLADRKLLVLEELSGLSVEEISNMSDVRSSGVARLDKGGLASQTPARTRLLCLSNVRSKTKRLADFLSGVKAVQELVGHAEDISRFDLVITLTDAEVSAEVINRAASQRRTRPAWAVADLRLLCQWVWSLRPEQIEITQAAARRCLELTLELGKDYHSGVPLFKASSDRHKIARVAVAIACLQFAWTGSKVEVDSCHMEAAARLLRALYDKPSLGYREWSRQMFDRENLRDLDELNSIFATVQPDARLRSRSAEVMIHSAKFSRDELCATATLTITQADLFLGTMLRCRATRKGEANTWEITPAGKRWLEDVVAGKIVTSHRNGNGAKHSQSPISFSEAFDQR